MHSSVHSRKADRSLYFLNDCGNGKCVGSEEGFMYSFFKSKGFCSICRRTLFAIVLLVASTLVMGSPISNNAGSQTYESQDSVLRDQGGNCSKGWQNGPDGVNCYMLLNVNNSWNESESFCKNISGHLAAINSDKELDFLQSLCSSFTNGCWVGGQEVKSVWHWSNCKVPWNKSNSVISNNCSYSNCSSAEAQGHCTLVITSQDKLIRENCNASHPFVCVHNEGTGCDHVANHREYIIILAVVSGIMLFTTLTTIIWLLAYRSKKRRRRSRRTANRSSALAVTSSLKQFSIEELMAATNSFAIFNKLGGNGHGSTYRGFLADGYMVAVKKVERPSVQSKKEFISEVTRVARLRHENIVGVIGCCYYQGERYVVYEYISNGTVDKWLHGPSRASRRLDWQTRLHIAVTASQGIAFLHDKVKPQVVHRDIRASNILLDNLFSAHLTGVGLSKKIPWDVTYERPFVASNHGYLPPEFVYRNELTTKSDIYSFGVFLLELISGRTPTIAVDSADCQSIFEWATPLVQSQHFIEILDPTMGTLPTISQVQKMIDLIYSCTQHIPSMRPRMSYIVHQLQQLHLDCSNELDHDHPPSILVSTETSEISVQPEPLVSGFLFS